MDSHEKMESPTPSGGVVWTRNFTLQFIQLYREHPCLWQARSDLYKSRIAKSLAFNDILEKLRPLAPNLAIDDMKRKINTLRSQYRRELTKILAIKKSSAGLLDAYEPTLWCYRAMDFLQDSVSVQTPEDCVAVTMDEDSEEKSLLIGSTQLDDIVLKQEPVSTPEPPPTPELAFSPEPTPPSPQQHPSPSRVLAQVFHTTRKRKRTEADDSVYELLKMAIKEIAHLSEHREMRDEHTDFARVVSAELRKMDKEQLCITKKVINEAVFLGSLGLLVPSATVVNDK